MFALLWFSGIGWDTSMSDVGWVYVILVVLVLVFIYNVVQLWRETRGD